MTGIKTICKFIKTHSDASSELESVNTHIHGNSEFATITFRSPVKYLYLNERQCRELIDTLTEVINYKGGDDSKYQEGK